MILEPKKIKSITACIFSPSVCREVMGPYVMILIFWLLSFKLANILSIHDHGRSLWLIYFIISFFSVQNLGERIYLSPPQLHYSYVHGSSWTNCKWDCFLSFCVWEFIECIERQHFCTLVLYHATWWNFFLLVLTVSFFFLYFLAESLGLFAYNIKSSAETVLPLPFQCRHL